MNSVDIENLERLSTLHDKGILDDCEYESQKQKLLGNAVPKSESQLEKDLEKLSELHSKGILTDEEFSKQKKEVLDNNSTSIAKSDLNNSNNVIPNLINNKAYFSYEDSMKLNEVISGSNKNISNQISSLPFKDMNVMFWLALLIGEFGVDRFMLGEIGCGIGKLISSCFLVGWIWWLVDLFTIKNRVSKYNYNLVIDCINKGV